MKLAIQKRFLWGDLQYSTEEKSPKFLFAAMKESEGANLDRIQIVKSWIDARGKSHEKNI